MVQDLPWRANLQRRIARTQIHRIEGMYAVQIDNMLKVPTHQHIDPCHCGYRYMLSIGKHSSGHYGLVNICASQCLGSLSLREVFNASLRQASK